MVPVTPKPSKIARAKDGASSSQKKMKQSSLLSFFSKQDTKQSHTDKPEGRVKTESPPSDDATALPSSSLPSISTLARKPKTGPTASSEPALAKGSYDDSVDLTGDDSDTVMASDDRPLSSLKRAKKPVNYAESDDEDDTPLSSSIQRRKKAKLFTEDNDSDNDVYVPVKQEEESEDEHDNDPGVKSEGTEEDDDDILALQGYSKRAPKPTVQKRSQLPIKKSPMPNKIASSPPGKKNFNKQNEERYHWLVNEKDAQGRPPSDPEYDPRTLAIPSSAWGKFTPFEKQYWEIKCQMWDCIVFFKKGKFFELYEKDALLANSLFDWKLAGNGRANMQLAGIPEMSFEYWASQFIQLGYKVAKVDQKESMLAKEMREGAKGIVKRELECVLTAGTLTDGDMIHTDLATYCLAIKEESGNYYKAEMSNIPTSDRLFGIAFIDTATGEAKIIEFRDDSECTKLDTIMSQVKPTEVIIEKGNLSNLANKIVKFNSASNALFNTIKPESEFYSFDKTYEKLTENDAEYFASEEQWPPVLQSYYKEGKKIGFSAFGGLVYYLKWLKLDRNLVSMGNIEEYNVVKSQNSLVLDGITLQNLEIFSNTFDGSDKGTLFKLFNNSITPMGKRMMKKWLMHPLLHKTDIEKRLDSVELLLSDGELRQILEDALAKLPDVERMLSRVHSCSIKVKDFERVIQGFESIVGLLKSLDNFELKGAIRTFANQCPKTLYQDVDSWVNAYDRKKAAVENIIIPHRGVEVEFDKSMDEINSLESELNEVLEQYKRKFKCKNLHFKDSGKEIFTIEVPAAISKHIPSDWIQMAANKTTKRYYSPEVQLLARSMAEARETHKVLEEDLKNRLCRKFDAHFNTSWMPTVHLIANIDCIVALARTSETLGFPSCRPTFVDEHDPVTGNKKNGFLKFKSLRHPCFNLGSAIIKDFIPNDIELGDDVPQVGLLTGANAAGKSTILRITCIAVIMAQMGCFVPCESAVLSPVDRIMTRLGANDNIMQGKSTFFVELAETKKILDMGTNRSLLVVDELGRGGSSGDGFAIAESVLHHVATHMQSLGFFATHYGTLGSHFKGHPQIRPMRMRILVDEGTRKVTFLYKLEDGASEGSFGMHVAAMCDIPRSIIETADKVAEKMEQTSQLMKKKALQLSDLEEDQIVTVPDGLQSDFVRLVFGDGLTNTALGTGEGTLVYDGNVRGNVLDYLFQYIGQK
ncbi:mismatch repair ATPase MSH6 KNAG_0H03020 [Huiozyma naganishii CBS 8797]|uniref:DNA mismatch repair protein n=1 Tax=Huiozyma naganishii (strain ATCC MYA-139 / BCRC 22969 / CBS 8797 / KCTC 17520 / NBRC 10181 / NCYC 3082 / Yp74L-3) TaxID=1071383 RepID=J7S1X9_HUIN7|nr:hypothetical protein KNAG_0H03020 [Kazachstania naganishii CBS 8797]CCK71717.1 hypothetical protein KNAG_0H03020 [Kazachstania naganishii CBS 8797]